MTALFGSPDKEPAVRLRVLEDAGRLSIPFTTGLLVGIGESIQERAETIFAFHAAMRRYGALQEIIVQNFRAKPDTAMRHVDDLSLDEHRAAIAVTRLVLGPQARIQAPPNLVDTAECHLLVEAGIDDWGGVSPVTRDHVNPERPWPSLEVLGSVTEDAGFSLRPRLTIYPEFVRAALAGGSPWLDPRLTEHVTALAGPDGLARAGVLPQGLPWQEPDGGFAQSGGGVSTSMWRSTPPAVRATVVPTSTRCTATGRPSPSPRGARRRPRAGRATCMPPWHAPNAIRVN